MRFNRKKFKKESKNRGKGNKLRLSNKNEKNGWKNGHEIRDRKLEKLTEGKGESMNKENKRLERKMWEGSENREVTMRKVGVKAEEE